MKTSGLTGPSLDWAVAKCEGRNPKACCVDDDHYGNHIVKDFSPSSDWSQGGPIIEREKIAVVPCGEYWNAAADDQTLKATPWEGTTPLIAAMRCYAASKFGDDVDVPDELERKG